MVSYKVASDGTVANFIFYALASQLKEKKRVLWLTPGKAAEDLIMLNKSGGRQLNK